MTMKSLMTMITVAILSSILTIFVGSSFFGNGEDDGLAAELAREALEGRVLGLERQLREAKTAPRRRSFVPDARQSKTPNHVEIDEVSETGPPEAAENEAKFGLVGGEDKTAKAKASKRYVAQLTNENKSMDEKRQLWKDLAKEGLVDDVIALLAEAMNSDPENPDLAADLGSAYVSKMRGGNVTSLERRELTGKAMAQFDRALSLDNEHWEARFSKSMMQVFAPPALGLGVKAERNLELLLDQQRTRAPKPEHAHTYFFLANLYENRGDRGRSSALRQEAASLFPEDERFRK